MIGQELGHYRISAPLGAGGMGEVYLAHDTRLDRQVAIKVLPRESTSDAAQRERLRREAMAAAALDHPFICKIFEIGEHEGVLFLVMEYIAGETLYTRLRQGPLALTDAVRIASQIADALELAHSERFLHRDLKPSNIMLTAQGHVKVMDFGLAKRLAVETLPSDATVPASEPLTSQGAIIGTPDYMSPEQIRAEALDGRSDLFSYGVLLAEMLTGKHPFRRTTVAATLSSVLAEQPDLSGDLPQGLMVMIRRLVAKAPVDRYPSAGALRSDLARIAAQVLGQTQERDFSTSGRIPLIGRDAEYKELLRLLNEAMAGRGSLVLIGGEPGIGKTHLITALLEEARRRGAYTSIGHCYEGEGAPPYSPFLETLDYASRNVPRNAFRHALGDSAAEVARLMPELRQIFPDIPPALELPPEQQRRVLFHAYREFVQRAAVSTPLVSVMEDLHWADEPSLLLLQHLAQSASGIATLMIGTYRDVELDVGRPFARILESLQRQKLASRISLRRLPVSGVEQMLSALSGQTPPPSLARVIFDETEGNPFFVEEVFRHLAEEGKLFDDAGAWRSGLRVDQLQVPEGVRLVLGRRLERLGIEAKRVLTTAAIVGRSFSLGLLERLEAANPDAVLDAVEEAERARLVEPDGKGRDVRYRFVHELVRQTLADALSLPRRQRLHARIAVVIEEVYAANLQQRIPALAHHLYQAGAAADPDKTIDVLGQAALLAAGATAYEEALAHTDNALTIVEGEDSVREAEHYKRRGDLLWCLWREQELVEAYQHAIDLFERNRDYAGFGRAAIALGMFLGWRRRVDEASVLMARLEQFLAGAPVAIEIRAMGHALCAALASGNGQMDRALEQHAHARSVPEGAIAGPAGQVILECECSLTLHTAQWNRCEAVAGRLMSLLDTKVERWRMAQYGYCFSASAMHCGEWVRAQRFMNDHLATANAVGHRYAIHAGMGWQGVLHLISGRVNQAGQLLSETIALGDEIESGWNFAIRMLKAIERIHTGNAAEAIPLLERALEAPQSFWSGLPEALLAWARWLDGDPNGERMLLEAVRGLPRPGCSRGNGCWGALGVLSVAFCLMGRRDVVGAWLAEAVKVAETESVLIGEILPVPTVVGITAACAGEWEMAESYHERALRVCAAEEVPVLRAIAHYWYGDMLREQGKAQARHHFEQCLELSKRTGLGLYEKLAMASDAGGA